MVEEPRHEDEDAAFGIAQDKLDLVKAPAEGLGLGHWGSRFAPIFAILLVVANSALLPGFRLKFQCMQCELQPPSICYALTSCPLGIQVYKYYLHWALNKVWVTLLHSVP